MNNFNESKFFNLNTTVVAIVSIIVGILFTAFPESLLIAVGYLLAAACIVSGLFYAISYFLAKETRFANQLAYGLILFSIGLYILFVPTLPLSIAPFLFGTLILISGFIHLQYSIELKRIGYNHWLYTLIGAGIISVFGILIMINPFATQALLITIIGVSLIVSGVSSIVSHLLIKKSLKK